MSIISNDGKEQIKIIKNALDSMYDKLEASGNLMKLKMNLKQ